MDPLLHAETLEYLCSFEGGMEDPSANQQMLQKVLAIREKHFDKHHWRVGHTLNNLTGALSRLGDPRTQQANLGAAYEELGQYDKAKDVLKRALKIEEQHYGHDDFEVARTLENLGNVHTELKDYEKAKDIIERALKIQEQHFGQGHFEVAKTLSNLGKTRRIPESGRDVGEGAACFRRSFWSSP